jgi:hypothetical protein
MLKYLFTNESESLKAISNSHYLSIYSNKKEKEIYFSTIKSKFDSISNEEFYFYYFLFYNQTGLLNII